MYLQGKGVAKNSVAALEMFLKAAEQGDISSQCILGALYIEGKTTPSDHVQAYKWFGMCADGTQGKKREMATKVRDEISNRMDPAQIEESRRLASILNQRLAEIRCNSPFPAANGVTPPVILVGPMPTYTEQARKARAEGIVLAQCVVRKDGIAGSCKIVRELGFGLDESAANTITARWRFKPGSINGEPVDVPILIETSFRLY